MGAGLGNKGEYSNHIVIKKMKENPLRTLALRPQESWGLDHSKAFHLGGREWNRPEEALRSQRDLVPRPGIWSKRNSRSRG